MFSSVVGALYWDCLPTRQEGNEETSQLWHEKRVIEQLGPLCGCRVDDGVNGYACDERGKLDVGDIGEHGDAFGPLSVGSGNLKGISIVTTMNTPGWLYWLLFGNAIKKALVLGTFWNMGYRKVKWLSFNRVKEVPKEKREQWLEQIERRFGALTA